MVCQIANDRQLALPHPIQLRRVDFKVHDFGVGREARRISGYAVVKPRAEHQQQIGFVQRHIRRPCAMHADHSKVIRGNRIYRTQAMYRRKGWNVQIV